MGIFVFFLFWNKFSIGVAWIGTVIMKVVEPIDVNFFDPLKYKPFSLQSV